MRNERFEPTASLETLELRAKLLSCVRRFFCDRGYLEVETPLLSRDTVVDAYIEPFVLRDADGRELFLQTSPEFAMKRLLAAGARAIFQITKSFRQGEAGARHNPEFTILEWYQAGSTYHEQMRLVEELVRSVSREAATPLKLPNPQFPRLSYDEAFSEVFGRPASGLSAEELCDLAREQGIDAPASLDRKNVDDWLNLLMADKLEPALARKQAVFVYDYPPGQSALARIRRGPPDVSERFELYLAGVEICNGYQELTNPQELRTRIVTQNALRRRDGRRELPGNSLLLDAMEAGLPECSGVALGFDRLLMALLETSRIADVIAFPHERA